MKKLLLASIAAATFCGAPAIAADLPPKGPVYKAVAPMFSWTGFYIGAHAGYAWGTVTGTTVTQGLEQDGWFGGGQLGYNYQLASNWVVGIEGDIAASGIDLRNTGAFVGFKNDLQYFGTLRGRLGYAWERFLVYGTGGWAWGHEARVVPLLPDSSNSHTGWTWGGGVEWAGPGNFSYKIEYLRIDLRNELYFPTAPSTTGWRGDSIKVGINYKFGDPWGKAPVSAKY